METIAAILFGIGVAGSTTLAVLTMCMIGSYRQNKRHAEQRVQMKMRRAYWATYWANVALLGGPPCTAKRNKLSSGNEYARATPDKLDVTKEFSELEKHKVNCLLKDASVLYLSDYEKHRIITGGECE